MLLRALVVVTAVFLASMPALADVGVIIFVGEGFDQAAVRHQIESNVAHTIPGHTVVLTSSGACVPGAPDARCIEQLVAGKKEIEEVAVISYKRVPSEPTNTDMQLRVFASNDWNKAVVDIQDRVPDAESSNGSVALLKRAFDPGHYHGRLVVDGAPAGAELIVDGLSVDEPVAFLSVGKHHVVVKAADGRAFTADVDIEYSRAYHLAVPAFGAEGGGHGAWTRYVAGGILGAGVATLGTGAVVDYFFVHQYPQYDKDGAYKKNIDNIVQWKTHARDTIGFLPAGDEDPSCRRDGGFHCLDSWSEAKYGPTNRDGVSEPAHFTMTAVSRQNELGWHAIEYAAVAAVVGGAAVAITGASALAVSLLTPVDEAAAPAAAAPAVAP